MELMEDVRFANMSHLVLDPCCESVIELTAKCNIPPMDVCHEAVELNQVFGDSLVVTHMKGFKVSFSFTYRVVRSKVVC